MMIKRTIHLLFLFLFVQQSYSQNFEIKSPNESIQLTVRIDKGISWSVSLNENVIIQNTKVGMNFSSGPDFGTNSKVRDHSIGAYSSTIYPAVPHKDAAIKDEFVQLTLKFKDKYQLNFRAYNDGVAYQFVDQGSSNRNVMSEHVSLTFPEETKSLFPKEESMYSHNERLYLDKLLTEISPDEFCSLPVVFITDKAKVLLTETALHNYPGMFVRGNGNSTMDAIFPKYVLEAIDNEAQPDRNQTITKEADYIERVSGNREYPWRVFMISDDDRTFVESNLTFQLSRPQAIENTEWIKPGKVAWDWYNANNIYGVDFKSGLNTATYKYYIDLASSNKIEYVILDEGWTKSTTEILD
ncbi:MAG: glycoside hydrolase family 97 N-terminal domain-containing protein, partial [Cyclobacteriaceae bacterium]|nr:glycoside hydrolase family 97 N-terminal domain-containing protein [Cyclobacteriaceae bacterium]